MKDFAVQDATNPYLVKLTGKTEVTVLEPQQSAKVQEASGFAEQKGKLVYS